MKKTALFLLLVFAFAVANVDSSRSKTMNWFISILENENYHIQIKNTSERDLHFKRVKGDNLTIPRGNYSEFHAKRKNPIPNMDDNWYPSFSVAELHFTDTAEASANYKKITEIITSSDKYNKKYDFLITNGQSLIYINCTAKIYEKYTLVYLKRLEEHIQQSSNSTN